MARTTVAALAALLVARVIALPEPYWATITALVVMQSSLVASWSVSWRRRPAWITAAHRFAEVSIGIAATLLITVLWPERTTAGSR